MIPDGKVGVVGREGDALEGDGLGWDALSFRSKTTEG